MKYIKITDLDEFLIDHIVNPYQNMIPDGEHKKINLDNFKTYINKYPEWWLLVINRILKIKFMFPAYIQHPLIDVLRSFSI